MPSFLDPNGPLGFGGSPGTRLGNSSSRAPKPNPPTDLSVEEGTDLWDKLC